MSPESNGWNEWSKHVLKELERLDGDITKLQDKVDSVKETIIELKVRVAVIGGLAGLLVSGVIAFLSRILSK